ncbi:MAG: Trm112 family protein [Deltaproteobacteria bacterium]|nr:Trm112 family protein [Deltaproteobacteria bacterium]
MTPELLSILVCPRCKGALAVTSDQSGLVCHSCALLYEIRDGIPVMLITEAKHLDEAQVTNENH